MTNYELQQLGILIDESDAYKKACDYSWRNALDQQLTVDEKIERDIRAATACDYLNSTYQEALQLMRLEDESKKVAFEQILTAEKSSLARSFDAVTLAATSRYDNRATDYFESLVDESILKDKAISASAVGRSVAEESFRHHSEMIAAAGTNLLNGRSVSHIEDICASGKLGLNYSGVYNGEIDNGVRGASSVLTALHDRIALLVEQLSESQSKVWKSLDEFRDSYGTNRWVEFVGKIEKPLSKRSIQHVVLLYDIHKSIEGQKKLSWLKSSHLNKQLRALEASVTNQNQIFVRCVKAYRESVCFLIKLYKGKPSRDDKFDEISENLITNCKHVFHFISRMRSAWILLEAVKFRWQKPQMSLVLNV